MLFLSTKFHLKSVKCWMPLGKSPKTQSQPDNNRQTDLLMLRNNGQKFTSKK
jgi:hypothetical protein